MLTMAGVGAGATQGPRIRRRPRQGPPPCFQHPTSIALIFSPFTTFADGLDDSDRDQSEHRWRESSMDRGRPLAAVVWRHPLQAQRRGPSRAGGGDALPALPAIACPSIHPFSLQGVFPFFPSRTFFPTSLQGGAAARARPRRKPARRAAVRRKGA